MAIHTGWESKVAGVCQPWSYYSWNENTHWLRVESEGKLSDMIVLFMKWKYALARSQKCREHVNHDYVAHEMDIRTTWEEKVAGTYQSSLSGCCLWNGNTHRLKVESGGNLSAVIINSDWLLMKWQYTLAEIQKWREYVTVDCITHEMKIRTGWESKVTGNCQTWLCCSWNGNTHWLGVKSGVDMSAMIVLLMKWKIRTGWDSKVPGTCQPWLCYSWNGNTHWLRVESGRNMSTMIVPLEKWKYAPTEESQKWREHVSHDDVAHEMEIRTTWEEKVAGTYQSSLSGCCLWNGNTHRLRDESDDIDSGGNMSAMTALFMKRTYAPTESQKWREHVSRDYIAREMEIRTTWEQKKWREHISHHSAAYEMDIRTGWKLIVAGTCQQWLITRIGCIWNGNTYWLRVKSGRIMSAIWLHYLSNGNTHWLRVKSGGNMSVMIVLLMEWKYALAKESKVAWTCQPWMCRS